MNIGWIKLYRGLLDHWIFRDEKKFKWWITILLKVNHEPTKLLLGNSLVEVGKGESVRSLRSWAKEFNTTAKTVKTFFELLQADGMIETKSIGISTHLKVCKWDSYQEVVNGKETLGKRKVNTKETLGKHELPTNKNEKNEKNEKNIDIPPENDFLDYVISVDSAISREAVQLKYKAWVENGWKDGNNKPIKNWKSKILNTMAYLPKMNKKPLTHLNQAANHDSDKF